MVIGSLVCVVGRVGSGKSALFMGMINEMRRLHGEVSFGGSVSLVPQQAWVQSGTVRDNITFSTDPASVNEAKVKEVIQATGLEADLDMWQDGDM
jgi:ATP-binding cassette subfamily C (CFTR/MRP) protein 1